MGEGVQSSQSKSWARIPVSEKAAEPDNGLELRSLSDRVGRCARRIQQFVHNMPPTSHLPKSQCMKLDLVLCDARRIQPFGFCRQTVVILHMNMFRFRLTLVSPLGFKSTHLPTCLLFSPFAPRVMIVSSRCAYSYLTGLAKPRECDQIQRNDRLCTLQSSPDRIA